MFRQHYWWHRINYRSFTCVCFERRVIGESGFFLIIGFFTHDMILLLQRTPAPMLLSLIIERSITEQIDIKEVTKRFCSLLAELDANSLNRTIWLCSSLTVHVVWNMLCILKSNRKYAKHQHNSKYTAIVFQISYRIKDLKASFECSANTQELKQVDIRSQHPATRIYILCMHRSG